MNIKKFEQYTKSEYFDQENIEQLKKLLPSLKEVNNLINRQEIINWFNENDIDYFTKTDLEMYIFYIENN
jgi:hypothetical protein